MLYVPVSVYVVKYDTESKMKKVLPPKPEPKTVTVTIKVRASANKALIVAAKDNDRSKSELVGELVDIFLKESGYLK
jgi:hypothetical protein